MTIRSIGRPKGYIFPVGLTVESLAEVEYLVVAGGGAGHTGGGGAGGLRYGTSYPISLSTSYPVSIGAGGTVGSQGNPGTRGSSGTNSFFGPPGPGRVTASGGGAGGANNSVPQGPGVPGGSGGAGAYTSSPPYANADAGTGNAGGYSPSEGNNGGTSILPWIGYGGGGGGGAGAVGGYTKGPGSSPVNPSAPPAVVFGAGGVGLAYSISGSSVFYGGGGGAGVYDAAGVGPPTFAGAGGNGGGGNGGYYDQSGAPLYAQAGTDNRGGGGGGGGNFANGSAYGNNGGKGVVILSYPGSQKATGGNVSTSGGKTIHTFNDTGTFTSNANFTTIYSIN
jgi:hypothetical protein